MTHTHARVTITVVAVLGLVPNPCRAQTAASGAVLGAVTDPSGAVISSAQIELTSKDTGARTTAVTTNTKGAGIRRLSR